MSRPRIVLNALTSCSLSSLAEGRRFLDTLKSVAPVLWPTAVGNAEPLKRLQIRLKPEALLAWWRNPFLWRATASKGRPGAEGSIWMAVGTRPTLGWIHVTGSAALEQEFMVLLKTWSIAFSSEWAFVHLTTSRDIDRGRATFAAISSDVMNGDAAEISVPPPLIRRYLPDFYWACVFGPPYVEMFGRDRLLAAPVHAVEELTDGSVYLQLTAAAHDLADKPEATEAMRLKVKRHLDADAFFNPGAGPDHIYRIPKHRLSHRDDSSCPQRID